MPSSGFLLLAYLSDNFRPVAAMKIATTGRVFPKWNFAISK